MKLALYQESRVGGRPYNQDRLVFTCTSEAALLVVADGMGGHLQGEVAAQIVVELLTGLFRQQAGPLVERPNRFLVNAIETAHQAILDYAISRHLPEVPSTTVVCALIQQGMVYWCHVGDSRLYLIDPDGVRLRTRDHSQVQRMIEQGLLTEETARVHPDRNKIYNCLGASLKPDIDVGERQRLAPGSSIVLCTDGLWGQVQEHEWDKVFAGRTVSQVMPALMNVAERRGGPARDNLSTLAVTLLPNNVEIGERSDWLDTAEASAQSPIGLHVALPIFLDENVETMHREVLESQLSGAGGSKQRFPRKA
jgi:serine/threonine protein phosphatase PrpC